jgi:hypothetical protein
MVAWAKRQEVGIPAWVQHDGFRLADWIAPEDFGAAPRMAAAEAWQRWAAARSAFLRANPDAFDQLLAELQSWCEDADS